MKNLKKYVQRHIIQHIELQSLIFKMSIGVDVNHKI